MHSTLHAGGAAHREGAQRVRACPTTAVAFINCVGLAVGAHAHGL